MNEINWDELDKYWEEQYREEISTIGNPTGKISTAQMELTMQVQQKIV